MGGGDMGVGTGWGEGKIAEVVEVSGPLSGTACSSAAISGPKSPLLTTWRHGIAAWRERVSVDTREAMRWTLIQAREHISMLI